VKKRRRAPFSLWPLALLVWFGSLVYAVKVRADLLPVVVTVILIVLFSWACVKGGKR